MQWSRSKGAGIELKFREQSVESTMKWGAGSELVTQGLAGQESGVDANPTAGPGSVPGKDGIGSGGNRI